MANPILVTGAAGRVGAVERTVAELLLKQGKARDGPRQSRAEVHLGKIGGAKPW